MDKKAKDILFKTYWSAAGWKTIRNTNPEEFEYAKSMGLMFDPLSITKPELISRLDNIANSISLKIITDAFLSSLTNKRLDWRSGLGSYANARRTLTNASTLDYYYDYGANKDLNVLNFERIKWGGVRHSYALYNLLDLELLRNEKVTCPTNDDISIFQGILNTIYGSAPGDTPGKLRDNLKSLLKFSKDETHMLMEILGSAEIIRPLRFDRKEPGKHDWTFITLWRGEDGYDRQKVNFYFGNYGLI